MPNLTFVPLSFMTSNQSLYLLDPFFPHLHKEEAALVISEAQSMSQVVVTFRSGNSHPDFVCCFCYLFFLMFEVVVVVGCFLLSLLLLLFVYLVFLLQHCEQISVLNIIRFIKKSVIILSVFIVLIL